MRFAAQKQRTIKGIFGRISGDVSDILGATRPDFSLSIEYSSHHRIRSGSNTCAERLRANVVREHMRQALHAANMLTAPEKRTRFDLKLD